MYLNELVTGKDTIFYFKKTIAVTWNRKTPYIARYEGIQTKRTFLK